MSLYEGKGVLVSAQVEALVAAANKGDATTVAGLLEGTPSMASASRQVAGETERCPALFRAAAMGHVQVVRLLLKHGADPNALWRDDYGTALTGACERMSNGAAEVVKTLLDAGADPTLADGLYMACTTYARNANEKHRVVRLLTQGGDTADQHAAVLAIHSGDVKVLTSCLARDPGLIGKRFTEVDYLTWPLHLGAPTLLHIAADFGETQLVQLLLTAGADINLRAGAGANGCGYQTAVFHAVSSRNSSGLDVLKLLIANRADLGVTAKVKFPEDTEGACGGAGETVDLKPLGLALRFEQGPAWRNSAEAVRMLRDAGAVE